MEKIYRDMRRVGAWNIALGVFVIVSGVTAGVLTIVHGGALLKSKSDVLF